MLRIVVIAIVVGAGGVVSAQTPVAVQLPSDSRHQVSVFENSLREAIVKAAGNLAERAKQVVPDIELRFQTDIHVFGTFLPRNEGVIFVVELPAIDATSAQLWDMSRRMATRNVASGDGRLVAPPPPPPPSAGTPLIAPMTDPNKEYAEFTRKALVDAILDNAFAVPLKEGQSLTVMVKEVPNPAGGTMTTAIGDPPRRLYLTIKAEDLLALRQTRITREEAQKRIEERRY